MQIGERATTALVKFSFRLERLFPQFIKYYLNRKLKEYKEKGLIAGYKVKAERKRKYQYTIQVDLFLEAKKGGE